MTWLGGNAFLGWVHFNSLSLNQLPNQRTKERANQKSAEEQSFVKNAKLD